MVDQNTFNRLILKQQVLRDKETDQEQNKLYGHINSVRQLMTKESKSNLVFKLLRGLQTKLQIIVLQKIMLIVEKSFSTKIQNKYHSSFLSNKINKN